MYTVSLNPIEYNKIYLSNPFLAFNIKNKFNNIGPIMKCIQSILLIFVALFFLSCSQGSPEIIIQSNNNISLIDLKANGIQYRETTNEIQLIFNKAPQSLVLDNISIEGAIGLELTKESNVYTLSIENLQIDEGDSLTLTVSNPEGYIISAYTDSVLVHVNWGESSETIGNLRYIPAGSFQRDNTSTNISTVNNFLMSQNEITRSQFLTVMGIDPSQRSISDEMDDPVQRVNWYQAIAFCNKLSLQEGFTPVYSVEGIDFNDLGFEEIPTANNSKWNNVKADWSTDGYRLPTEMEWMWAAMGATMDQANGYSGEGINSNGYTKGYSGSTEDFSATIEIENYSWIKANSGDETHSVGTQHENELGLNNMNGNVSEWCWDWHTGDYKDGALMNYRGENSGLNRRYRGGNLFSEVDRCAVAFRGYASPGAQSLTVGLRVVR